MALRTGSSRWRTPARCRPPRREPRSNWCPAATTIARHNGSWYSVSSPRTAYVESRNRSRHMKKTTLVSALPVLVCGLLLGGCGLADVGAAAATGGSSAADQVKKGKDAQAKVEKQIEEAQQAAADARTQ